MRRTSIRELHIHTSELVREAAEGTVIVIERRGEPVAELRPLAKKARSNALPDLTDFWNSMPQVKGDSGRYLEEDR